MRFHPCPPLDAADVNEVLATVTAYVGRLLAHGGSGARGDETPRRFTRGDQRVEILAVVAQWRTPDHRYFRVKTAEEPCTLRQDVTSGAWALTAVKGSAPR